MARQQTVTLDIYRPQRIFLFLRNHLFPLSLSPQPCYERVKDWLNENLVALWIFALCTALTQVITVSLMHLHFSPFVMSSVLMQPQMETLPLRKPERVWLSTAPLQRSVSLCAPAIWEGPDQTALQTHQSLRVVIKICIYNSPYSKTRICLLTHLDNINKHLFSALAEENQIKS